MSEIYGIIAVPQRRWKVDQGACSPLVRLDDRGYATVDCSAYYTDDPTKLREVANLLVFVAEIMEEDRRLS